MKKKRFLKNAAILTITSLILRSIGIVFRIYISNRIGAEGMGLYQMIISIYILGATFATGGLTVAVTKLCADEDVIGTPSSTQKTVTTAIALGIIVGVFSGFLLYVFAKPIALFGMKDIRAISSLRILSVSFPFMGVSASVRGYFTAKRKVGASSLSQILEQFVRIGVIAGLLNTFCIESVEGACFTVLLGDTVAEISSCLFMITAYQLEKRRTCVKIAGAYAVTSESSIPSLLAVAAPITIGRYISSGLRTAESWMVPNALSRFYGSRELSLSLFGQLKGMALPLVFFPSSFLASITTLLIPELSQSKAVGDDRQLKRTIQTTLQITMLSSVLIAGLFWLLAEPLSRLIYNTNDISSMLRFLSFLVPIMYLESIVVGLLKGIGQQTYSLIYSIVDSVIRLIGIPIIIPQFGIQGFYAMMVISNVLTCSLNLHRLCKATSLIAPLYSTWFAPITALIIALLPSILLSTTEPILILSDIPYCILLGIITTACYTALLFVLHCVTIHDIRIFKR